MWGTLFNLGLKAVDLLRDKPSGDQQQQTAPSQGGSGKGPTQSLLEQVLLNRAAIDEEDAKKPAPPQALQAPVSSLDMAQARLHEKPFMFANATPTVLPDPIQIGSNRRASLIFGDK
jgi:hypothetical protein